MQDVSDALLSTQKSLLGIVSKELRAVVVDLHPEKGLFFIRFYYDGEASESFIDLCQCAITEASAGLDSHYDLDEGIERWDEPLPLPASGWFAYCRKESKKKQDFRKVYKEIPAIQEILKGYPTAYALLVTQNALLGLVTPELRAVIVDFEEATTLLYVRFYYDGKLSLDGKNLWDKALKQIDQDFEQNHLFDGKIEQLDFPEKIPFRGRNAYRRCE